MGINCYYHMKQCNIINANMTMPLCQVLLWFQNIIWPGPKYFGPYCRRTKGIRVHNFGHHFFFAVSASEGKIRINTIYS